MLGMWLGPGVLLGCGGADEAEEREIVADALSLILCAWLNDGILPMFPDKFGFALCIGIKYLGGYSTHGHTRFSSFAFFSFLQYAGGAAHLRG